MEQFDTIIIGNDITSLITALFLSRKMRNVLIVQESKYKSLDLEVMSFTDPENHKFHFEYQKDNMIYGIKKDSLLDKYLETIGLNDELILEPYTGDVVVDEDSTLTERILSFDQFRVYLIRYFPRQRDQIHRFFKDLERHYLNFSTQYKAMLTNMDYTLTSLMIEWGDYSLEALLKKYFQDLDLIQEFLLNNQINGLDADKINSYHFFMNFFMGLKDGIFYMKQNTDDLRKILIKKLQIVNPNPIQTVKIKKFFVDENNKITGFIDHLNHEFSAKHFIVSKNPKEFYEKYFADRADDIAHVCKYYPNLNSNQMMNTLYLALSKKSQALGFNDLDYYFKNDLENPKRLIRLFNYQKFDKEVCESSNGAICIDFTYLEEDPYTEDDILKRITQTFPKLKKNIVGIKIGKPKQYLSMLSDESVRKGLSINDQIAIEAGEHTQILDNLYLTGQWLRPEASIFGQIHSGIVLGDKIEEKLYYGEDDDTFYYLTNDEIMMMIRHNYKLGYLGEQETHVNFQIGKSNYFTRTKRKNITIHRGNYSNPDLTIFSTNDKLSNLLLKQTTFEEVLKTGGFKYLGNKDMLYNVINAFGLDDFQVFENKNPIKSKIKFSGIKFMFLYLLIYSTAAFLSNFIETLWIMPFALVLTGATMYFKMKVFGKPSWFEYFINAVLFVAVILSIFIPDFSKWRSDDIYLTIMGLTFFISWIANRPIVYEFHKHDYRTDYASSYLFRVINNGLTFIWVIVFLGILIMTYVAGARYVSVLYNLVFLGIFLNYYYPILYVKTNIKK